ncbi:HK97 family phage prohead protease [Rossellomorea sp. BNER]|uniref:HK97 family phage prohead protease n=1 Tax=Rossellomorea sp. BNER TaxID=2962031 RepID=UPI003AF26C79|nr:HK97 family phage prohead protease [Rossellomorea sp. BNER]
MNKEKEIRQITTDIELRAIGEEGSKEEYIEGYALKFERWSEVLGWGFKEIISREALDNADMSDVIALFNHSKMHPLARNNVESDKGNLSLEVDNIGLKFRFNPTDTSYAKDLKENMRSGIINKCSFAFYLDYRDSEAQEWDWDDGEKGYDQRRINKIAGLTDISIVTTPAYKDTESVVSARCLESKESRDEHLKQEKQKQNTKRKLELELELS